MAALALLSAAPLVQAQGTPGRMERADPLDARARVPAAVYQSPLAGYRRLGEDRRISWKEANETVNRIGGWRAYAREAQQPDAAASAPGTGKAPAAVPAPAPSSAPAPGAAATPAPGAAAAHGGHRKH